METIQQQAHCCGKLHSREVERRDDGDYDPVFGARILSAECGCGRALRFRDVSRLDAFLARAVADCVEGGE